MNVLTSNARDYVVVDSPELGEVLFVAIGATNVGTVEYAIKPSILPFYPRSS